MSNLYIVGTPIGNIKDITLRALDTLKAVDVIACEDTRVTSKLLAHYNIKKRLISYHDHNEKQSARGIIELIENDQNVAIVSDAGMPVINDPGFEVIRQAIENNVEIEVIPGVSATLTTLVLSNFDTHFKFLGFLKPKTIQRQNQLQKLDPGTYIIFASPHRIEKVLDDMETVFGKSLPIFIGRELTKKFESHYRGTIEEVKTKIKDKIKGEFTIAISVPKKEKVNKYDK